MERFCDYLLAGRLGELSDECLQAFAGRWEWFSLPRRILAARRGAEDSRLAIVSSCRLPSVPEQIALDAKLLTELSPEELIERFLQEENLRIVAGGGEPETEVRTVAELDEDEDMESEALAEIYLAQGLCDRALATYRKLSLLNPEKSVYFAEIIRKIETNN